MKNYTYSGKSNLTFTFEDQDHLVHGHGPHSLPENSVIVKTLVAKKLLTEAAATAAKAEPSKAVKTEGGEINTDNLNSGK